MDDQVHPQMIQIHGELEKLSGLMHDAGYLPDTKFVLHDVEEEEKVFHLCHHSGKLAIAFGLIVRMIFCLWESKSLLYFDFSQIISLYLLISAYCLCSDKETDGKLPHEWGIWSGWGI